MLAGTRTPDCRGMSGQRSNKTALTVETLRLGRSPSCSSTSKSWSSLMPFSVTWHEFTLSTARRGATWLTLTLLRLVWRISEPSTGPWPTTRSHSTLTPSPKPQNYKDHIDEYESETLPQWLGYFERWMKDRASSELHFVGNTMTFVDLLAWDLLDVNLRSFPACLEAFPRLTAFYQTLPTTSTPLAKYIDSAVRKKTPQNGSRAFFDNTVSSA
mmetsp:Transcript_51469/g.120773  ORF Transcript_51469/g.120773 Transcript_51469/m.120773 type:complete len:214 (+) Transcript_51469:410-1051(+)